MWQTGVLWAGLCLLGPHYPAAFCARPVVIERRIILPFTFALASVPLMKFPGAAPCQICGERLRGPVQGCGGGRGRREGVDSCGRSGGGGGSEGSEGGEVKETTVRPIRAPCCESKERLMSTLFARACNPLKLVTRPTGCGSSSGVKTFPKSIVFVQF